VNGKGSTLKKQNFQTPISQAESQAACKAVLASDKFVHAPRMCRLLHFLVESAICGNSRNTSEYAIGIEVFDRNVATYSTTEDPAVRVQVGRLREKLKDYYAAVPSEIEISIPLGSYMPIFRRASDANTYPEDTLLFRPIRAISECTKGQCFALGLHEELLHQLFLAFNSITLIQHSEDDFKVRHSNESKKAVNTAAKHLFEGFVRIDSQRVRTSVHLLDLEHNQIRWSKQFDRNNCYDISLQEELAFSICQELKLFMLENGLDHFGQDSPLSEQAQQENRITHIGQGRRLTSQ
jgi:TolB-like protein